MNKNIFKHKVLSQSTSVDIFSLFAAAYLVEIKDYPWFVAPLIVLLIQFLIVCIFTYLESKNAI